MVCKNMCYRIITVLKHKTSIEFHLYLCMAHAIHSNLFIYISMTTDIKCKVTAIPIYIRKQCLLIIIICLTKKLSCFLKEFKTTFFVHIISLFINRAYSKRLVIE